MQQKVAVRLHPPLPRESGSDAITSLQLLTPREAARTLAISERTLWTLTHRGDVRAVRFGRAVRYDPRDLRALVELAKGEIAGGQ